MKRGDLYWFEPDPVRGSEQSGRRPAVVVSRDSINQASLVVVIVPLTTFRQQRLYPSDVLIEPPDGGLSVTSVALGLQIGAVDKQRLKARIGILEPTSMARLERALSQVLDLPVLAP